jgi:hypothetical protein
MQEGNYEEVINLSLPPRILRSLAHHGNLSEDQIAKQAAKAIETVMGSVAELEFSFDLGKAQHRETKSGAPYMLIPTRTAFSIDNKGMIFTSNTLAMMDEGKWFLVSTNELRVITLLHQAYPDFAGVEFDRGTTEIVPK